MADALRLSALRVFTLFLNLYQSNGRSDLVCVRIRDVGELARIPGFSGQPAPVQP
jgi:hypothetical protein